MRALLADGAAVEDMVLVEVDAKNAVYLEIFEMDGALVHVGDFLDFTATDPYDRVVMNPPFSVPGRAQADIDHVLHAFDLLAPGGRLVAIMSGGVCFRENVKSKAFRQLVVEYGEFLDVADGAFAESGTGVRTCIVRLDKPGS